ncbi:MAG TPA: PASTA domain-containing protein, partial [Acidimicrobiales bacterium]|nr:PASTA domain-containing protein [Acidimicrobiales bacterium]
LERAGSPVPAERPDAGALGVALMATANALPRPEPLTLAVGEPTIAGVVLDDEATNLTRSADDRDLDLTVGIDAIDDLPDEWEEDRRRRRWPWVVLAILFAAALGGGAAWYWNDARTPSFDVPRLIGLTEEAAREAVSQYGWRIETVDAREDGSTPGEVLGTDPAPGASLREGGTLELRVSLGNTLARLPTDLVGRPLPEAQAALERAGGFTVAVLEQFDEEVAAGTVLALGPDVPAELAKGSEVALVVSKGPQPRVVPEGMSGGTYEQAAAALEAVGLTPKRVEEFHDTITPGKVISSRPGPGAEVPRGGEVEVIVSKGPDVVKVPGVSGLTLDQATAAIERAGLTVGEVFGPANGRPFDTNPSPGTSVKRGTTVDIYLRR